MGRFLQIRVSAVTFCEDEVRKAYKSLWELAWEDPNVIPHKGVPDLAEAIYHGILGGMIEKEKGAKLRDKAEEAERLRVKLVKALNDRDPQAADKLSYELEDCLDSLEDIAANF